MSRFEELMQKLLNGETITEADFPIMSRLEKALIACINKTGTDGLDIPQSRAEELLQLLSVQMTNLKAEPETEELTVIPSGTAQEFTPSEDTYFNKVTVEAVKTETISISPTENYITKTPSEGKYFSKVTVNQIKTETTTVKSGNETQTVTPTSGYYFKQVTVEPSDLVELEDMSSVDSVEENKLYRVSKTVENTGVFTRTSDGSISEVDYQSHYIVIDTVNSPDGYYWYDSENNREYDIDQLACNYKEGNKPLVISREDNKAYNFYLIDPGYSSDWYYQEFGTDYYTSRGKANDFSEMTEEGYYVMYGPGAVEVTIVVPNDDDKDIYVVKDGEITGNYVGPEVESLEETTIVPSTTDQIIEGGKYLSGQVTVKGDANLVAENIKEGVTLYSGTSGEIVGTCASGGGAASGDMLQARVDATNNCEWLFYYYTGTSVDYISNLDTSNVTKMSKMFYKCTNLQKIPLLNTSKVTDMSSIFYNCTKLTTIPQLDTSSLTNAYQIFYGCAALATIPQLDISNCTNTAEMFYNCSSLTTIPLLDTSKVTNMLYMFQGCSNLTTVPQLDVSKAINVSGMFTGCSKLKSILMTGMKVAFSISASTQFEREDLVTILNNLATVTSAALTMGSTNLAKLTEEDQLIATAKGWTLK